MKTRRKHQETTPTKLHLPTTTTCNHNTDPTPGNLEEISLYYYISNIQRIDYITYPFGSTTMSQNSGGMNNNNNNNANGNGNPPNIRQLPLSTIEINLSTILLSRTQRGMQSMGICNLITRLNQIQTDIIAELNQVELAVFNQIPHQPPMTGLINPILPSHQLPLILQPLQPSIQPHSLSMSNISTAPPNSNANVDQNMVNMIVSNAINSMSNQAQGIAQIR